MEQMKAWKQIKSVSWTILMGRFFGLKKYLIAMILYEDPRCAVTEGVVKMDVLIWDNIYKPLLQSEDRVEARDRNQPMVEQCGWKFWVRRVLAGQDIHHNITVDFVTSQQGNISQE